MTSRPFQGGHPTERIAQVIGASGEAEGLPLGHREPGASPPRAEMAVEDATTWTSYVAGIVETYLQRRPAPEGREKVIAGIIERRLWALPIAAAAVGKDGDAVHLHPATTDLVRRFTEALTAKLAEAEKKYGYRDGWLSPDWMDECRAKLLEHVAKGDPRDVAAYCAFLWHHGESTAATQAAPSGRLTAQQISAIHEMPYVRACLLEYADRPCDEEASAVVKAVEAQISALVAAPAPDTRVAIVAIMRDACEAEPADPDHPESICIRRDHLHSILEQHLAADAGDPSGGDLPPAPEWATGFTDDPMAAGAQLCTRDGRKIGNAVTCQIIEGPDELTAEIVTDFGNTLRLSRGELNDLYYLPMWLMDVANHPGVQRQARCNGQGEDAPPETVQGILPALNDDLIEILGRPNFACAQIAEVLRHSGIEIKHKAEHEQAAVLHYMLGLYLLHGTDWWLKVREDLEARAAAIKERKPA